MERITPVVILRKIGCEVIVMPLTRTPIEENTHPLFRYRIKIVNTEPTNELETKITDTVLLHSQSYLEGQFLYTCQFDEIRLFRRQNYPALNVNDIINKTVKIIF